MKHRIHLTKVDFMALPLYSKYNQYFSYVIFCNFNILFPPVEIHIYSLQKYLKGNYKSGKKISFHPEGRGSVALKVLQYLFVFRIYLKTCMFVSVLMHAFNMKCENADLK